MSDLCLVTGAAGHLGYTIVRRLLELGRSVRALVLPGDRAAKPPIVLLVAKVPTAASLETRLKAHAPRRLLGLHFLPDGSCLLVLSDGD